MGMSVLGLKKFWAEAKTKMNCKQTNVNNLIFTVFFDTSYDFLSYFVCRMLKQSFRIFIVFLLSVMGQYDLIAQEKLLNSIKSTVEEDSRRGDWNATLQLIAEKSNVRLEDALVNYASKRSADAVNPSLKINSVELRNGKEFDLLSHTSTVQPFHDFLYYGKIQNDQGFAFVKMTSFFDSRKSVEDNIRGGLNRVISELNTKHVKTVIFADDFGLSSIPLDRVEEELAKSNFTTILIDYDFVRDHFPHDEYYYVDLSYDSEERFENLFFYNFRDTKSSRNSVNLVSFFPEISTQTAVDHLTHSIYSYLALKSKSPNIAVNFILLEEETEYKEDERAELFSQLRTIDANLGSIFFRKINLTSFNVIGINVPSVRESIFGYPGSFDINFIAATNTRETWVNDAMTRDQLLILGDANTKPIWMKASLSSTDDLVGFLANYLNISLKSPKPNTSDRATKILTD